jgi:hypothetical protein
MSNVLPSHMMYGGHTRVQEKALFAASLFHVYSTPWGSLPRLRKPAVAIAQDVAQWAADEVEASGRLYQERAVRHI